MEQVTLGKTGITVWKNGFGALPVQRVPMEEAILLLRRALEGGITYYDTARAYSDSEEKLGKAFAGRRQEIFLSTKTQATDVAHFWSDLETSLKMLGTDYIDIYQFHNPAFCPKPGDGTGLYEAMLEARSQGKIRFIGITNHRMAVAEEACASGLYDTLQFPFSYLSTQREIALVEKCREAGMGFLAMKALAGGLITNAKAAYAFMARYPEVLPIWGIQRRGELEEFLAMKDNAPSMTEEIWAFIEKEKTSLAGDFCRGCGYCMPCPVGIQINNCARMSLMLRRAPSERWLTPQWQANMKKIEDCLHCNACAKKCPYGLDTPALLRRNLEDYKTFLK